MTLFYNHPSTLGKTHHFHPPPSFPTSHNLPARLLSWGVGTVFQLRAILCLVDPVSYWYRTTGISVSLS